MNKKLHIGTIFFLFAGLFATAQTIVWTGASNSDFFNEANWKNSVTNTVITSGINPGANINLTLQINTTASITATGGAIQFGTGSLAIGSANLSAVSLSGGSVTMNEGGYIDLSSATPLLNNVQINFTSGIGWIRTTNYDANAVSTNSLGQIKVNNAAAVYQTNLRLDHYYLSGCVIRANLASAAPLTVYNGVNLLGNSGLITVNTIHSGSAIVSSMNNRIKSFVLKKGYMVTFAIEEDGTGKSKNYIASESDLVINALPKALTNSISFIRVMPWNWVTKKGRTDYETDLNSTWVYKWNASQNTTLDWEYAPMAWMYSGASDTAVTSYIGKYNSTHVMGFNEPDACDGQSGQYPSGPTNEKLCNPDVAVAYYKNLMKTGMRLVSPATREGGYGTTQWLYTFITKATAQDVRIDAIAVHWYDWGGVLDGNASNDSAAQIFARFQAYITNFQNTFNLPIWITEFNANPARSSATNAAFMALALPWLETQNSVERYAWFPYNTTTHYYGWDESLNGGNGGQTNTTPTAVGTTFKNQVSTPSIPETTVTANSNLNVGTCVCN